MQKSSVQKLIDSAKELPFGFVAARLTDQDAELIYVNQQFYHLCGYQSADELMAATQGRLSQLVHPDDFRAFYAEVLAHQPEHRHVFYRVLKKDGRYLNVEDSGRLIDDEQYGPTLVLYVTVTNELINRNVFDQVTGLHERAYLRRWVERQRKYNPGFFQTEYTYVIAFNISGFKNMNQSSGFQAGNRFLRMFAHVLESVFKTDAIERIYADHFAVFYHGSDVVSRIEQVKQRGEHLVNNVPLRIEAGIYQMKSGESLDEGVEKAESACKYIHNNNDHYYAFYTHELASALNLKLYVQLHIDEAIEKHWIKIYLQPVVRTLTGKVCGFEALSRWDDPTYGMISPGVFVPALEEKYLSYKLAEYVVNETASLIARQQQATGRKSVPVSLNFSRRDFSFIDPSKTLEKAINKYHIDPSQICVEITESTAMENPEQVRDIISRLHGIRYSVWMDDFGSSYSSLNALKDFDFDEIKLDMAFMRGLNDKGKVIVESCVNMAKKLGIQTLCEGVENKEQMEFLKEIGCEKIQGFYFSKPLPIDLLNQHMRDRELEVETPIERDLFNGMTSFCFDRQQAWFLAHCHGDDIRIIFRNEKILKDTKHCDFGADFELVDLKQQGLHISPKLKEEIMQVVKTHQSEKNTYFDDGSCFVIQANLISQVDEDSIVQVSFRNVTSEAGVFSIAALKPTVQSILSIYDSVYQIDYDHETIEVLVSDIACQNIGDIYPLDLEEIGRHFAGHDAERFVHWISKRRVLNYFKDSDHIYESSIFKVQSDQGEVMKNFILIHINESHGSRFLLAMRDIYLADHPDFQLENDENVLKDHEKQYFGLSRAQEREILYGLTNIFVAVLEIDAEKWRCSPVVLPDVVMSYMSQEMDYRQACDLFIERSVAKPDQAAMRQFISADTVLDALTKEGVIAKTYHGAVLGWLRMALVPTRKDKNGRVIRFLLTTRDVNNESNEKQYMNYLIEHDTLTEVYNRSAFERVSAQLKNVNTSIGLMMIDVDSFKSYNDTYGHEVGDAILQEVAKLLETTFRASDYVIRMGGDEFAVVLVDCASDKAAAALLHKITEINQRLEHPSADIPVVSISAGLAISQHGFREDLYHDADTALYEAKESGKQTGMFYNEKNTK